MKILKMTVAAGLLSTLFACGNDADKNVLNGLKGPAVKDVEKLEKNFAPSAEFMSRLKLHGVTSLNFCVQRVQISKLDATTKYYYQLAKGTCQDEIMQPIAKSSESSDDYGSRTFLDKATGYTIANLDDWDKTFDNLCFTSNSACDLVADEKGVINEIEFLAGPEGTGLSGPGVSSYVKLKQNYPISESFKLKLAPYGVTEIPFCVQELEHGELNGNIRYQYQLIYGNCPAGDKLGEPLLTSLYNSYSGYDFTEIDSGQRIASFSGKMIQSLCFTNQDCTLVTDDEGTVISIEL